MSWVIYLDIPEVLKFENSKYKGRSAGPGGITFIYGDGPRESVTHHSFVPKSGDMYIFPAWLKHWVYPFKSDCTRISVSGNIVDSVKLNRLKNDYSVLGYSTLDIKVYEHKIYSLPVYLAIMTLLSGIIMFNSKYKKSKVFNVILGISLSVIIYYVNYFSGLLGETGKIPIILSVWLPMIVLMLISLIGLVRLNEK